MDKLFTDWGQTVATRGVADQIAEDPEYDKWVRDCLFNRYRVCDWGDLGAEDKGLNEESLTSDPPERILARYNNPKGDIWIITERDRSVTTILHPSEY